jgi:elongation factor P--(R)-beta-lysine ligase
MIDWRPTATPAMLQRRAQMLARARSFFAARQVMEVDTPIVVNAPVTDVHIHSAQVTLSNEQAFFLHTSPEYAMKRLLAAGSGDIYQVCHVVRSFERGRLHNSEFTLIEWYRRGFSLVQLMREVEDLVRALLGGQDPPLGSETLSYREAFLRHLGVDPFTAPVAELAALATEQGYTQADRASRDELLELLMSTRVGPRLGSGALTFVHGYPASQAALARLDPEDPRAALRFELYSQGVELANGFHELASASEQRARFTQDLRERERLGLISHSIDERLLAALESGLPDCAGVALGFDRLVMIATDARSIEEVLPFPTERA